MTPIVWILVVMFVVVPVAAAVAKRIEAGPAHPPSIPDAADPERIAQIEGQIDALVEQVQVLAEHQEFLTRLLEENTESRRAALTEDGDR
ncbi:MAG: hypothetical protein M8860_10190 [marine benthic group bacterium]|jgi:hypothetical protein|nr:hypothetical protein [Gemmatimonadota bacterium]MCL7963203.1 hypothetical protein [Candidatus Carthagonibacter metallireducens]MCL7938453.1 hypothetical protein [Gemmatimonadota bacterium]MCL7956580.1 hypothetical protein [Gemmatimonadota bacterium]MCL7965436.1 hypothetical protein [Gemmatimonadota bacterium]